jgi:serine/alanine adding enzyme
MTAIPPQIQPDLLVRLLCGQALVERMPSLTQFAMQGQAALSRHPGWLYAFRDGMGHVPYAIEATIAGHVVGFVPLCFVRSSLFGRFLVSLPYLNTAGIIAGNQRIANVLIDRAVELAHELDVRYLELRHETIQEHEQLNGVHGRKVHMRLDLPDFPGPLWESLHSKVRNQVRKGEKTGLKVIWGTEESIDPFYHVFSINMRDLGTPVYGKRFFRSVIEIFPKEAEFCVIYLEDQPIAGGLLVHGNGISEILSASSLREFNTTNANMLMYWNLLQRSIERGSAIFDFGRSTIDSSTFKFKKQWGSKPHPANWQYHLLSGQTSEMRPDNPKYERLIRMWQRLPVPVTRWIGPHIVRGIP